MPKLAVESIFLWIRTSLEPLEVLWVNYHRLCIAGINGRTTSIGEALHWASKGAFDGVKASMNVTTSANTQMLQAERKGEKVARLNAKNVQMHTLWSKSNTHEYLTDYAERLSAEQHSLAEERKCVMVSDKHFWVYKPHETKKKTSEYINIFIIYVVIESILTLFDIIRGRRFSLVL